MLRLIVDPSFVGYFNGIFSTSGGKFPFLLHSSLLGESRGFGNTYSFIQLIIISTYPSAFCMLLLLVSCSSFRQFSVSSFNHCSFVFRGGLFVIESSLGLKIFRTFQFLKFRSFVNFANFLKFLLSIIYNIFCLVHWFLTVFLLFLLFSCQL